MALVLSMKNDEDFFVGDRRFVVMHASADGRFSLVSQEDRLFRVTDEHNTEILPEVFVSAGDNPPSSTVRVVIEAPRDIIILRGDKKRQGVSREFAR